MGARMVQLSLLFVSLAMAPAASAEGGLTPASGKVSVSSGWSGPTIEITLDDDNGTYVPVTEQAAAQAMSMVGKGTFNCKVKTSGFAAGSGEGKAQHQVFSIENCAR